jgi:hypothetical protein
MVKQLVGQPSLKEILRKTAKQMQGCDPQPWQSVQLPAEAWRTLRAVIEACLAAENERHQASKN